MWLATRAGKYALYFPLFPAQDYSMFLAIKWLLLCQVVNILHLFLCVYGLWLRLGPETSNTIMSTISTNLDLMHVWSITQKAYMSSKTLQWLFLELSYHLKKAELKNISRFFWLYEQKIMLFQRLFVSHVLDGSIRLIVCFINTDIFIDNRKILNCFMWCITNVPNSNFFYSPV